MAPAGARRRLGLPVSLLAVGLLAAGLAASAAASETAENLCGVPRLSFQWASQLRPEHTATPAAREAALRRLQQLTASWMQSCSPLSHVEGPAALSTLQDYGFTAAAPAPKNTHLGDFGSFSEWRSVEELLACYQTGLRSGQVQAIRNLTSTTVRLLHELSAASGYQPKLTCPGTRSYEPARFRYSFSYILGHPGPDSCTHGSGWLGDLVKADGSSVRYSVGCDVAGQGTSSLIFGSSVGHTADLGGNVDFKNMADLRRYLDNDPRSQKPGVLAARTKLRSLSATVMRIVIALPAGVVPNAALASAQQP